MNITFNSLCDDLLVIPIEDGYIDISWCLDTDTFVKRCIENNITKIYDFHDKIDFIIQIDSVNTFNSVNLKEFNFRSIEQIYVGNMVFSAVVPFNKNQPTLTNYYLRVKVSDKSNTYLTNDNYVEISIEDSWSESINFTIPKNFTKDIVEYMYRLVADFNAYNKEVKSANFYYLFQAFADTLNKEFKYVLDLKNSNFLNKAMPDDLYYVFGDLFKFTNVDGLSMEEYRRLLRALIIGYQNGGAWYYIKNVLKYLIGYTPELITFKNFYPWILRDEAINDPEEYSKRTYYNPETNFYLFKSDYQYSKNRNQIMLISSRFKKFTFVVKTDNFFNLPIDESKVRDVLDILKPAYTMYILNLNLKDLKDLRAIKVDDNTVLLSKDGEYIQY